MKKKLNPSAPDAQNEGKTTPTSFLSCEVCNVTVNSPMQMAAHNIGGKHKNKVQLASGEKKIKLSTDDADADAATSTVISPPNSKKKVKAAAKTTNGTAPESAGTTAPITPTLTPIARTNGTDEKKKTPLIPKAPKPVIRLTCEICGISVNSEAQLTQHKTSKKHLDKLSGKTSKPKPKLTGANKTNFEFKSAANKTTGTGKYPLMSTPMPPLSQSFVKKDLVYF